MRVLVTGARGFVGKHVVEALSRLGHTPLPISHAVDAHDRGCIAHVDVTDESAVRDVVSELQPDACIHLAGISFVPMGWRDPERVLSVNTIGTVNVLEACRQHAPQARVLFASSAEVYGRHPGDGIVTEDTPCQPDNPYALSKMTADLTTLIYHRRYGMHTMSARPHNHIGPGQAPDFVLPSFARQLMAIQAGEQEAVMRVGNLESKRYFTDVRDIARAYVQLIQDGTPGRAYNIASNEPMKIAEVLKRLCDIVGVTPTLERDDALYRPTDTTPTISCARIKDDIGWTADIPLSTTLSDLVDSIRAS